MHHQDGQPDLPLHAPHTDSEQKYLKISNLLLEQEQFLPFLPTELPLL